jgi:uncharacterized membrane protein
VWCTSLWCTGDRSSPPETWSPHMCSTARSTRCAAAAGVVIVSAFQHAVLTGALIALALVPAAALVGAGLVAGEMVMTLEALRRVGLDVLLVVGLGAAVMLLKQRLIHHNRQPLI